MTLHEFTNRLDKVQLDVQAISEVYDLYNIKVVGNKTFDRLIMSILQNDNYEYRFDNESNRVRLLTREELLNPKKNLYYDFIAEKQVPIFDTGDFNFLVYDLTCHYWKFFNIYKKSDGSDMNLDM